jgi:membrane protease YdiL (CAAX protease family)
MIIKLSTFESIIKPSGNRRFFKICALLGIGCALIIISAFIIMGDLLDNNQIIRGLTNEGITKVTYPFVFINIVFVNAFLEEFFFRGFVFLTIYKMGYKMFAYIYSSILFSIYHTAMIGTWFSPLIFMICMVGLAGAGLIFNDIAKRCDNIYGGYLVHLGANIGINLIGAYLFLK